METMRQAADRLDDAASTLDSAYRRLVDLESAGPRLGEDPPGRFGELDRALRAQWTDIVESHAREAAATAARLAGAAESLRVAAAAYVDADQGARRRLPEH